MKYMKRILLSIFLVLFFANACSNNNKNINVIQIDPEQTSRGMLSLSDIIESIEYVPLETNADCLIGVIRQSQDIKVSNNYILVYCSSARLCYLFSRTGKFIGKIGDRGNGPGEYQNASLFSIDEKNRQIILSTNARRDSGQVMYYNLDGKYLYSRFVDKRLTVPIRAQFNNEYVAMHLNNPFIEGEPSFNYSVFSGDYELITQKIKNIDYVSTQRGIGTYPGDYWHYLYNDQLHVKNAVLNDTVYSITKEFQFAPKYIINAGKYSFSTQILSDPELYQKEYNRHIFLCSVFETNHYVIISYTYNDENFYQYYDKRECRSMLFHSATSAIPEGHFGVDFALGIPNDYDGGLDFWPRQQNGNEFITWYDASLFVDNKNDLEPRGHQRSIDQLTKVASDLKEFQANHKTEANPVVIIAKLK